MKITSHLKCGREAVLVMKLIMLLLTVCILQVSAASFAQQITLRKTNAPLGQLLKAIREQSGYDFFYNNELIKKAKPVTIDVTAVSLKEALDKCFLDQPITYTLSDKAVVLKAKAAPSLLETIKVKIESYFQSDSLLVTGKVTGADGQGIIGVNLSLLAAADSALVKLAITDQQGAYQLQFPAAGTYRIQASHIGYQPYLSEAFVIPAGAITFKRPVIILNPVEKQLKEVMITARKNLVEVRADRTVLNIAGSINATGSNAFDLLRMAPGTRVMGDEVTVNGKSGLIVYRDGNQVNLQGTDLAKYLRTVTASGIESLEIITNPSSRYDAAGNAGIINIISKKNSNLGFNGSVSLTGNFTWYKPKYDGSLNLNYRSEHYNVYGNYDYNYGDYTNNATYFRRQSDAGVLTTFDQQTKGLANEGSHNFKGGVDFFLSAKSTAGIVADGSVTDTHSDVNSKTAIYRQISAVDSQLYAGNLQTENNKRWNYNANYRYNDAATGRKLNLNANYGTFNYSSDSYQPNRYTNAAGATLRERNYQNYSVSDITVFSFNGDYSQKLLGGELGMGIKYSDVQANNSLRYFNVSGSGLVPDPGRTNQFDYNEKITAAYVDYKITLNKWNVQAGVRTERTGSKGVLTTLSQTATTAVDTSYINFFPNAQVNYKLNEQHRLALNYNSRIGRPAYQKLNPFEYVFDELSYVKGNPFLKPQYSNELKLTHLFNNILTTSFAYNNTSDKTITYRMALAGGKTSQTTINLGRQVNYSFNTSLQLTPTNWWNMSTNFSAFRVKNNGIVANDRTSQARSAWSVSSNQSFTLFKDYRLEISGYYNSRLLDVPAVVFAMYAVDMGVQRSLFNNRSTLRFSVSDVFNTLGLRLERDYDGLYYVNTNKWESRQFRLSYSWRFGGTKVKGPESRRTGNEDERNRIK